MSSCNPCQIPDDEPPVLPADFIRGAQYQRGGICTLLPIKCNVASFDETNLALWQALVNAGDVFPITDCGIKGSFAESATTATVGCNADTITTNRPKTLTVIDQRDTDALARAEFWRYVQANPKAYRLAFITHDGVLYKSAQVNLNPLNTVDEDTNGFMFWTIEATWTALLSPVTYRLAWSASDIVIPSCFANLSVMGPDISGDYTMTATASGTSGVASVTAYRWYVNNVLDITKTTAIEIFTGLVATDVVKVEIDMVLNNATLCTASKEVTI